MEKKYIKDFSYKKQIWKSLWEKKCQSIVYMEQYELGYLFYVKFSYTIKCTTALISLIITIIATTNTYSGADSQRNNMIIGLLAGFSIFLMALSSILNIDGKITNYISVSSNFKFLSRELEKNMVTNSSVNDLKITLTILSSMFSYYEQLSYYLPKFLEDKFNKINCEPPTVPESPNIDSRIIELINTNDAYKNYFKNKGIYRNANAKNNKFLASEDFPLSDDFYKKQKSHNIIATHSNSDDLFEFDLLKTMWKDVYTILKFHVLTKKYYIYKNIGHYRNGINGEVINVCKNLPEIVSIPREDVISPNGNGWTETLHRKDARYVYNKWMDSTRNQKLFFEKYRFVNKINEKINYVIAESYPVYTEMGVFDGMEGVILIVPKKIWIEFDTEFINNNIFKNDDNSYNYSKIPEVLIPLTHEDTNEKYFSDESDIQDEGNDIYDHTKSAYKKNKYSVKNNLNPAVLEKIENQKKLKHRIEKEVKRHIKHSNYGDGDTHNHGAHTRDARGDAHSKNTDESNPRDEKYHENNIEIVLEGVFEQKNTGADNPRQNFNDVDALSLKNSPPSLMNDYTSLTAMGDNAIENKMDELDANSFGEDSLDDTESTKTGTSHKTKNSIDSNIDLDYKNYIDKINTSSDTSNRFSYNSQDLGENDSEILKYRFIKRNTENKIDLENNYVLEMNENIFDIDEEDVFDDIHTAHDIKKIKENTYKDNTRKDTDLFRKISKKSIDKNIINKINEKLKGELLSKVSPENYDEIVNEIYKDLENCDFLK